MRNHFLQINAIKIKNVKIFENLSHEMCTHVCKISAFPDKLLKYAIRFSLHFYSCMKILKLLSAFGAKSWKALKHVIVAKHCYMLFMLFMLLCFLCLTNKSRLPRCIVALSANECVAVWRLFKVESQNAIQHSRSFYSASH